MHHDDTGARPEAQTNLRSKPAWVVGQQGGDRSIVGACLDHPAEVKISDLDTPVSVHQHVGRFQVSVQYWWLVRVQLEHTLHQEQLYQGAFGISRLHNSLCS